MNGCSMAVVTRFFLVCLSAMMFASVSQVMAQAGPPPQSNGGPGAQGAPNGGGPGGPQNKEEPVTVPPAGFDAEKALQEAQRLLSAGKYAEAIDGYVNPIINYYAYRYGTRGRRMFVAHDATETAIYVATGARALDLSTDDGVVNGQPLPPATYGSRNIVVPTGTLSEAFAVKASALAKQGKLDESLQMLGRSTVLSPSYPTYWNDIADVYVQAGRCEEAAKAYAQVEQTAQQMTNAELVKLQTARAAKGKTALSKCQQR